MGLDALKSRLPGYAKDLKLNLGSVIGSSTLPEQLLQGTVLSTATASRNPLVLRGLLRVMLWRRSDDVRALRKPAL